MIFWLFLNVVSETRCFLLSRAHQMGEACSQFRSWPTFSTVASLWWVGSYLGEKPPDVNRWRMDFNHKCSRSPGCNWLKRGLMQSSVCVRASFWTKKWRSEIKLPEPLSNNSDLLQWDVPTRLVTLTQAELWSSLYLPLVVTPKIRSVGGVC